MLPDSFLVYLEGEGIAVNYSDMADHAVKHHSNLKLFNLILLWGDAQVNSFKKYKDETVLSTFMQLEIQNGFGKVFTIK